MGTDPSSRAGNVSAELARQMQIPATRLVRHCMEGCQGRKYIIPIIEKLGGNVEDFEELLKVI